ncbi:MAG: hypothetical protein Q8M54_11745 [Desulfobaccales bacterium]|nr:hypothetical protein [Desulfobaccales bacterium]
MNKFKYLLIIFLFSLFINSGCAQNPENQILGKWEDEYGRSTTEFFKDGTIITIHKREEPIKGIGKYKFIGEKVIKVDYPPEVDQKFPLHGTHIFEVKFPDKDKLALIVYGDNIKLYNYSKIK